MRFVTALLLLCSVAVHATNGFIQIGYGPKSRGMGGVGIAYAQDSFASAVNPAGMVQVGRRVDLGVSALRHSGRVRLQEVEKGSSHETMVWPEAAINTCFCGNMSAGFACFFNGQWDIDFDKPLTPYGTSDLSSNYGQIFFTPSWSWQFHPCHSVGVAVNGALTWLRFNGLENLVSRSTEPDFVTNNGTDYEGGISARFGWLCHPVECVQLGLTYLTPTWVGTYEQYRGFLPEGKLNLPSELGFGVTYWANPDFVISFDAVKVFWRHIRAYENELNIETENQFGARDGPGFSWDDQLILKLGMAWHLCRCLTLRTGYNHGNTVLCSSEAFMNVPNMQGIENHLTMGATVFFCTCWEANLLYLHGFRHTVSSPSFPLHDVDIVSRQNCVGISLGYRY